ncbi:LysR substrate-binding domain-containing protein [Aliiroseovarius sp. KMU-50]|uniref:LysR substrate-binding domain-containing protein n=1 Tax=Aliiroseovarius salicola TaxID=3009082 RepID=A0ABT4W0W9_9RHOB|nr:LysR substrate-binding domain-containing protein [Aliiroseovarius sp. KMU-50]MDA5094069.1 LysR substrate-binding domain-containing protein [Aliiroseovarius sp. KMU-50]
MRKLPNLNQLRVFEAASRHQSFKEAANELCVTQAAVSHQIKALEEHLGVQLFRRLTREVRLTPVGAELAPTITQALDQLETATTDMASRKMSGSLRISAAPFYTNRLVLPRLSRFHDLYPDLKVQLMFEDRLVDFQSDDLEAGLRYGDGNWPGLTALHLHGDRIGPVCAPSYVDGAPFPLPPDQIAKLTLGYIQGRETDWHDWFLAAGLEEVPQLMSVEYKNRARMLDLALSGNGVALADARLTQTDEAQGQLLRLHPMTIPSPRGMYLVFPETPHPDPRILAFAEWLKSEILGDEKTQ